MKKLFTGCLLLSSLYASAQSGGKIGFQFDQSPTMSINGQALLNPWAGGLNAAQYSTMRLNADSRDDLVVFDRTTSKISTFIAIDNPTGSGIAWQYAPQYETAFPTGLNSWLLLVDYDGDGRKDLYTSGNSTVRVFHNDSQNGTVAFSTAADPLITQGLSGRQPLFVSSTDIPAVTDYDDDGDIDIITFDADGNILSYQQNMSVEQTGKPALTYVRTGGLCWGHFRKEYCNDFTFGLQCDGNSGGRMGSPAGARPAHTGNTLTVVDTDGDGKKDLLFGFVSCENIARLQNSGPNSDKANFTRYDSLYPATNPILFPAFPSVYWEDVDGDGQKDLLASPNVTSNDAYAFDFQASGWFYKNTGTTAKPALQLIQKNFLQADMLDLGEGAAPALADLDGDGDLDLLVGYAGVGLGSAYRGGIWQFENKGTTQNPAFALVTTDYLGLNKTLNLTNVVPSFVDVDANGSTDLVIVAGGNAALSIRVLFNGAAKGAPTQYNLTSAVNWPVPGDVGPYDRPTAVDVDKDGKPDLLVGRYSFGTILYYHNVGTAASPTFQLQNQTFGGIKTDDYIYAKARSIVVSDLNGDQKNELILAADNGTLRVYDFPDPTAQSLTLIDSLPSLGMLGTGLSASVGDLNGDGLPDLMLGSRAGGVRYLKNTSQKIVITATADPEPTEPWVFPNPTERYLTIRPPRDGQLDVLSLSGQVVVPVQGVRKTEEIQLDLGDLPDGTYLLRLSDGSHPVQVQKVVVWK